MPYQLHCWVQDCNELDELETVIDEEELLGTDDEEELLLGTEDDDTGPEDEVLPEQTLPLMVGISAEPPFLFIWKPKLTVWPGDKLPFQFRFDAVYGLLPETLAFHEPLKRLVAYCQLIDQPLIAAEVELVIRISPVAPVFHSLVIT